MYQDVWKCNSWSLTDTHLKAATSAPGVTLVYPDGAVSLSLCAPWVSRGSPPAGSTRPFRCRRGGCRLDKRLSSWQRLEGKWMDRDSSRARPGTGGSGSSTPPGAGSSSGAFHIPGEAGVWAAVRRSKSVYPLSWSHLARVYLLTGPRAKRPLNLKPWAGGGGGAAWRDSQVHCTRTLSVSTCKS